MVKIAVLFAPGYEEIEAITPVDVFRRAELDVDMVGFDAEVTGAHGISIKMDRVISDGLDDYDLIVLPGGLPGATNLRDDARVISALQSVVQKGGRAAAICAAPIVLERAGLLNEKQFVSYPGFEKDIPEGHHQGDALVVVDGQIITSRGPATSLEFSYQLLEELGIDSEPFREGMQYQFLSDYLKEEE